MWPPRPRFTVRGLMIGVAIVALALAGIAIPLHRLRMADYHRDRATILESEATRGELMCMTPQEPEGPYIEAGHRNLWGRGGPMQKRAFEHRRLARAYRRLAYRPWLPVVADPPESTARERSGHERQHPAADRLPRPSGRGRGGLQLHRAA